MDGRGGDEPPSIPVNGGEFLLHLLRNPPNSHLRTPTPPQPSQPFALDPAIAAVGPSIPTFPLPPQSFPSNGVDLSYDTWSNNRQPFAPHHFFQKNPILNPDLSSSPWRFNMGQDQFGMPSNRVPMGDSLSKVGYITDNSRPSQSSRPEQNILFGSVQCDIMRRDSGVEGHVLNDSLGQRTKLERSYLNRGLGMDKRSSDFMDNSVGTNGNTHGHSLAWRSSDQERRTDGNKWGNQTQSGNYRKLASHPPGFSGGIKNDGKQEYASKMGFDHTLSKSKASFVESGKGNMLTQPFESRGFPVSGNFHSISMSNVSNDEEFRNDAGDGEESESSGLDKLGRGHKRSELEDLEDRLLSSLGLAEESDEKSEKKIHIRDKEYRSDKRGQLMMGQRMRNMKRQTACRRDIHRLDMPFLAVYDSLIPADEEKIKQKQLLTVLEKLVNKEWPNARLYLYGSCANSFGFSKSDLDVCLAIEDENIDKCDILLKLADILQSNNFQNVQALTRARVPIVKLMDPETGISCDVCINNVLAVVNTKLLQDYSRIDVRLRQLAFIVKHWAKSRGVNETYQGTLSSYAYVLMCIHFLQQRWPAILPCLQGMHATYSATINDVECAYFDQVDNLSNFGSQNGESIAQLVWSFFFYWAYCHDYASDVISIRTGSTLSKRTKDWTRRVGNDRHLICIEDPFEVSHDLGRVVDKHSVRVLREEFERAAQIMQHDPNPVVTLFEPYVPPN